MTDDAARASAIMEAIEYAVAEAPEVEAVYASAQELRSGGAQIVDPTRFMREGHSLDEHRRMAWYYGRGLITHRPCAVPADLVRLDGNAPDLKGICQNTNGLASGNTEAEAVFHGLCELVERDAQSIWLLKSDDERLETAIDTNAFGDDSTVGWLIQRILGAGLELRLFDQTTDIGVPVIMAVIGDRSGSRTKFAIAAGYGAHPSAHRATLRALAEAAQTRITSIAGARDDIAPAEYTEGMSIAAAALLDVVPRRGWTPQICEGDGPPEHQLRIVSRRLMQANVAEPVVVPLRHLADDFSVVRVLAADLEDAEVNLNWRPGKRARHQIASQ